MIKSQRPQKEEITKPLITENKPKMNLSNEAQIDKMF